MVLDRAAGTMEMPGDYPGLKPNEISTGVSVALLLDGAVLLETWYVHVVVLMVRLQMVFTSLISSIVVDRFGCDPRPCLLMFVLRLVLLYCCRRCFQ